MRRVGAAEAGSAARAIVYAATGTAELSSVIEAAYHQLEAEYGASDLDEDAERAVLVCSASPAGLRRLRLAFRPSEHAGPS